MSNKKTRKQMLKEIVERIKNNKFNLQGFSVDELYSHNKFQRNEYQPISQRDSNNYGYLTSSEMNIDQV